MKNKKIEKDIKGFVINNGNFQSVLKRVDQNTILSQPRKKQKGNIFYTLMGLGATLVAASIMAVVFIVTKPNPKKENNQTTHNQPSTVTPINALFPTIGYNEITYSYATDVSQPINASSIGSKISSGLIISEYNHLNYIIEIYNYKSSDPSKEIAVRFTLDNQNTDYYLYRSNL